MDMERLKQWLELAQKFQGKGFWDGIFDDNNGSAFINDTANSFGGMREEKKQFPAVDVLQNQRSILILIDLPGLNKSDVELSVAGKSLLIKGTYSTMYPDMTIIHSERQNSSFQRSIELPEVIDQKKITAKFNNGVLEVNCLRITMPKESIQID